MKRIIAMILSVCLLCSLFAGCDNSSGSQKKLTIMMYVVGSNLESEDGYASSDFREILNSKIDLRKVNILIYTGGARRWKTNISSRINTVYQVVEKNGAKEMEQISQTQNRADMGDPNQLSSFLNLSYQSFPSDQYALICWNHGGGPNQGFGYDENYEDFLEIDEFETAFEASPFNGERKLSWIGFDACLMGSVEVADALKKYADYMIASEELEPGRGWDYSFLSDLKSDYSAESIAKNCIDKFYNSETVSALISYGSALSANSLKTKAPVTLSCVNLNKIDPLNQALNALFAQMNSSLQAGDMLSLVYQRQMLYSFGMSSSTVSGTELDLVDIGELAESCRQKYPNEAQAVLNALSDYVVYERSGIAQSSGASIYYPFAGIYTFYYFGGCDSYTNFSSSPGYVDYIRNFTDQCYRGVVTDDNRAVRTTTSLENAESVENMIKVTLTDEQKKTFSKAYVNVLEKIESDDIYENNDYLPLLLDYQLEPDSEGNIVFDSDLCVPVKADGDDTSFWPMRQVSKSSGSSQFRSLRTNVIAAPEEMPYTAWENVSVNTTLEDGSDEFTITDISYAEETGYSMGKSDVDLDNWNYCSIFSTANMLKYDKDGKLKPYEEWEDSDTYYMRYYPLDDSLVLKMRPLSQCSQGKYYYQVVIEDIYGGQQASDLFDFTLGKQYQDIEEKTKQGKLTYRVFEDHVEVKSYEGQDSKLTIPATYKTLPVTSMDKDTIASNSEIGEMVIENPEFQFGYRSLYFAKVKKVTLPEGMKTLSEGVFSYAEIEEINLPSSLETIGRCAFMGCENLKELKIPAGVKEIGIGAFSDVLTKNGVSFTGENENYKIENDYLLSKDGKILYSRFEKSNECIVPDGVEEIAGWGCLGSDHIIFTEDYENIGTDTTVTSVQLPDSLRIIHSDAFRNNKLTELTIPDSVEYIGHNAFANYELSYMDENMAYSGDEPPVHISLKIGKGLKWLGEEVLGYNDPVSVEVDPDNPCFCADGNKLMNKAGDCEIPLTRENDKENERESEYKALEYLWTQLDESSFEPATNETYTYEDNTYYQSWRLKKDLSRAEINSEVVIDGKDFKLPCKASDFLKEGFTFNNPNDESIKFDPKDGTNTSMVLMLENKDGKKLQLYVVNDTEKPISIKDARVTNLEAGGENDVSFMSNGVSASMEIKKLVSKLGNPESVQIRSRQKNKAFLYLSYSTERKKENRKETYTLTLTYEYDVETGKALGFNNRIEWREYISSQ